jgi:hypothetical protein
MLDEEGAMAAIGNQRSGKRALCWIVLGGFVFMGGSAVPAVASDATICRYLSQLPDDCGGAVQRKYDNLRNYRYAEIDLSAKDILKKILYKSSYNTTGLNGGDDSKDSAPQSLLQTLNLKAIAKQYQALFVSISPPRYWTIDWLTDRFGRARDFGGLDAAWMGNAPASTGPDSSKSPVKAYRFVTVPRTSIEGFKKGSKVYLLDDPKGRTWVMRSYTAKQLKDVSIDNLDTLGDRIGLPAGWKFRTVVLAKDLILEPKSGVGGVTEDDKENVYDLTGPGQSNYKP